MGPAAAVAVVVRVPPPAPVRSLEPLVELVLDVVEVGTHEALALVREGRLGLVRVGSQVPVEVVDWPGFRHLLSLLFFFLYLNFAKSFLNGPPPN